jgi:DNA-binding CsgD family transcriptional regulator
MRIETDDFALLAVKASADARPLVGRESEIEQLAKALTDLKSGTGRAIALVGEPGIGKSALVRTALAQARAAGVPVLAARGGRTVPATSRTVDYAAVMTLFDDLHDCATDQIPNVERLIETAATEPVLCLLAYRRRQVGPELAAVLSRASSLGLVEVWNLQPLSEEHARELVGDHPNADDVLAKADGNPQYLQVMAAADEANDAGTAILAELAGLDPTSQKVLEAAAALGGAFGPELLAAVADLDPVSAAAALDGLTRVDLVRQARPAPQLSLRHAAVGKVVYRRLEPGRRTELHRRAEAELAKRAAPIAEWAFHIAQAPDPLRPEHPTILIAAARDILYADPALATRHLEVALTLLQKGGEYWYEAQVLLARSRLLTGDAAEGQALLGALRAEMVRERPEHATALADSSRIERLRGRYSEAGALARAGLAALADNDSATAMALHVELAGYAYDLQDYQTSQDHAETAAKLASGHGNPVGEAHALSKAALALLCSGSQASALAMLERAAELLDAAGDETLVTDLETAQQLGLVEGLMGRLADAERHLARGAALSRRTGQVHALANILINLGNSQLRAGNLRGALASLDESVLHSARTGSPVTEAILAALRAEALFWRDAPGDLSDATAAAERAASVAGKNPTAWAISLRCFNAEFVLNCGDPARARWLLLEAAGGTQLPLLTTWRRTRWCDTLAQAAASVGDGDEVERWARMAEASVQRIPSAGRNGFALRARMRVHIARGDIDRALGSAHEAFADFATGGERIELARTLLDAAKSALDAGRTSAVGGWLDRVALIAEQCGSARLAAGAAHQRARLETKREAPRDLETLPSLSTQERKVADLATTGMTNKAIAETLFLSVRTVESHLAQVYRKLGVSNRTSLARIMLHSNG